MTDPQPRSPGLTFYHQKRMDGGVRTGIMIGETTVLGRFQEGEGDYDPVLIWSVDLRCTGAGLPPTAEAARQWLLDNAPTIQQGFLKYADDLRAGSDVTGPYLLEWGDFPHTLPGVEMRIVCGALRRFDARALADVLNDVGRRWQDLVTSLAAGEPATA